MDTFMITFGITVQRPVLAETMGHAQSKAYQLRDELTPGALLEHGEDPVVSIIRVQDVGDRRSYLVEPDTDATVHHVDPPEEAHMMGWPEDPHSPSGDPDWRNTVAARAVRHARVLQRRADRMLHGTRDTRWPHTRRPDRQECF